MPMATCIYWSRTNGKNAANASQSWVARRSPMLQLTHLFHKELCRLIGTVLVSADDALSPTRLRPQVREALGCLLEGDGEKQAAARMGLSRDTMHQYVKTLYRHYQVASRAELLSRVLCRLNPPG
jgi:DNA-binding NarL/FixJ family response regulator